MKSERILIYGGKGLLGSMWREEAKCYASIVFPRSLNNLNQSGYTRQHTLDSIISDIEESGAKTILNCRALTNVEQCEKDFQLAHELNVLFPGYLADAAQKKGCRLIHISTDHLYGKYSSPPYRSELDPVDLVNNYARSKYLGECEVLNRNARSSLIIRTNFFGRSLSQKTSYTDWLISEWRSGRNVYASKSIFFNPVHYTSLIGAVRKLSDVKARGIFNISSNDYISKYDFCVRLAEMAGYSINLICDSRQETIGIPRPENMVLSNEKLFQATGLRIGTSEDQMRKLFT